MKKHIVAATQPGLGSAVNQTAPLKVCAVTLCSLKTWSHHTTFSYLSLPLQNGGDYNVYLEPSEDLVSSDMSIRSGLDAQHTLYRER